MEFVLLALISGIAVLALSRCLAAGIATSVTMLLVSYVSLPVLSPRFLDLWNFASWALLAGAINCVVAGLFETRRYTTGAIICAVLGVSVFVSTNALVYFVLSSGFLHADEYAAVLGRVETVQFKDAIQRLDTTGRGIVNDETVIDQTEVIQVDQEIARRRAQVLVGQDPEFGGSFMLGTLELTRRDGRLVWAAPLEFSGFSRWRKGNGTPAYVWVDAHDAHKAELVKEVKGKPLHLRCIESAYFWDNLERAVWSSGLSTTGLAEHSFEIDNEGSPKYVVTTYTHRVGFSGQDPTGAVVFDPQTCQAHRYGLDNLPSWVNRVVPSSMVFEQIQNWGEYKGGWMNQSVFGSHSDTREPTKGIALVSTTKNGDTAWYVGITTAGNPNGTTGFMLIDSRTKKVTYFEQSGTSEDAAANSMLGKISEKRNWTTTWPILYNVDGRATYLSVLKDGSGNFGDIALMPVDDPNTVVIAGDLRTAVQAYAQRLAGLAAGNPAIPGGSKSVEISGVVARIASEVINGNTVYWITLEQRPGTVLSATNGIGPQVSLTRRGDVIKVEAQPQQTPSLMVVQTLENLGVFPRPGL